MQCNDRLGWAEACAVQRHSRCTTSIYFYTILGRGCTFVILCMMRPTATASSDSKPHRHHSEFSTSPTLPLLCGQCRGSVEAPRLHAVLLLLPACSPVHLCAFAFAFSAAQCDCDRRFAARAGFLASLPARAALAYILCARAAYPRRYAVFHSGSGSMHST